MNIPFATITLADCKGLGPVFLPFVPRPYASGWF